MEDAAQERERAREIGPERAARRGVSVSEHRERVELELQQGVLNRCVRDTDRRVVDAVGLDSRCRRRADAKRGRQSGARNRNRADPKLHRSPSVGVAAAAYVRLGTWYTGRCPPAYALAAVPRYRSFFPGRAAFRLAGMPEFG